MFDEKKEKIDQLKEAYNKIPVPAQARASILGGIHKAKKERQKSRILRIIRGTGVGIAAAMVTITVMVNTNQSIANAMERIPVIGAIARVVTFRTYESNQKGAEAKIQIPEIKQDTKEDGSLAANKSMEEYADTLIRQFEAEIAGEQEDIHYQLTSTYEVATDTPQYLSIRINTTEVMAGGFQRVKILTIDKATGDIISLKQLFQDQPDFVTLISDNIKQQMRQQMEVDDSKLYFLDSEMPESDFKEITGEESFYFNAQGELVIVFDEYQVAPGYMGIVEFTLPKEVG